MRIPSRLAVLSFAIFTVAACDGSSDPTTPIVAEGGWQVVLQANEISSNAVPVAAVRNSRFAELTVGDAWSFGKLGMVFSLASPQDTVWVGYAVYSELLVENFRPFSQITSTFAGNIKPVGADTSKIQVGALSSLYEARTFVSGQTQYLVSSKHAFTATKDDFLLAETVTARSSQEYHDTFMVIWRPMVCRDFSSRKLQSTGIQESQTDGGVKITMSHQAADITITCNRPAPAVSNRSAIKLIDLR